jgi:cytochrome c oxidase cbb3-type subunit IV
MKFKNYVSSIENVNIYPIISLVLFTVVFVAIVVYVFTADKKSLQDKANVIK